MASFDTTVWAMGFARALPITLLMPFAAHFVPRVVSVSVALVLAGVAALQVQAGPPGGLTLALLPLALRELCLGLALALGCALPLYAVAWVGRVADEVSPFTPVRAAPLALLYELLALTTFFLLGGHRAFVASYAETFVDAPLLGRGFDPARFAEGLLMLVADALALSVSLALPLLACVWALSWAQRWAERPLRPEASALTRPIQAVLWLGVVVLTLVPVVDALPGALRVALTATRALVRRAFA